jgi:hypothetical protein
MSELIGQGLIFDTFLSLSRWRRRVKDAFNTMLHTSATWSLTIALDLAASAANARIGKSAGILEEGEADLFMTNRKKLQNITPTLLDG